MHLRHTIVIHTSKGEPDSRVLWLVPFVVINGSMTEK